MRAKAEGQCAGTARLERAGRRPRRSRGAYPPEVVDDDRTTQVATVADAHGEVGAGAATVALIADEVAGRAECEAAAGAGRCIRDTQQVAFGIRLTVIVRIGEDLSLIHI